MGCRRFLEESRGDRAHVYDRVAITESYTTLKDATRLRTLVVHDGCVKGQSDWMFADAWVLTAVAISQAPCSLTKLVASADGINHAIPLEAEVDDAVRKLLGSGLLHVTPDLVFGLTPKGSALVDRRHGSLFTQVDSTLSMLASVPSRDQEFSLPPDAMQEAVNAYRAGRRKH